MTAHLTLVTLERRPFHIAPSVRGVKPVVHSPLVLRRGDQPVDRGRLEVASVGYLAWRASS